MKKKQIAILRHFGVFFCCYGRIIEY